MPTPIRNALIPFLFALASLSASACSDAPRVGVVDLEEAFQRSPLVMVSAHQIKGDLGPRERDLKQRGRALAEMRRRLEHGGLELAQDQRAVVWPDGGRASRVRVVNCFTADRCSLGEAPP